MIEPSFAFKNLIRLALLCAVLLFSGQSIAATINSQGAGETERSAIQDALLRAVDASLGTVVQADTLVENFETVRQRITTHSQGFITKYDLISTTTDASGLVKVTIKAEVDDGDISRSVDALKTLMSLTNHPKVVVAAISNPFDTFNAMSEDFEQLDRRAAEILRQDFAFEALDNAMLRRDFANGYRHTRRDKIADLAAKAGARFAVFISLSGPPPARDGNRQVTLKLDTFDLEQRTRLGELSKTVDMHPDHFSAAETKSEILDFADKQLFALSTQSAALMVEKLKSESYDEGRAYTLSFQHFPDETLQFIEQELPKFSGFVRQNVERREKNALSLSYRSMLAIEDLEQMVQALLKTNNTKFNHRLHGNALDYRYVDPLFN